MADSPVKSSSDAPAKGGKDTFGFLTKKVFGIPIWVIAVIAVAIWYWYTHYGPGKKSTPQTSTGAKPAKAAKASGGTRVVFIKEPSGGGGGGGGGGHKKHKKHRGSAAVAVQPTSKQNAATSTSAGDNSPEAIAGQAQTAMSPDYANWVADQNGVPGPGTAYAPMTAGSVYG